MDTERVTAEKQQVKYPLTRNLGSFMQQITASQNPTSPPLTADSRRGRFHLQKTVQLLKGLTTRRQDLTDQHLEPDTHAVESSDYKLQVT